jgi:hypothetical protein
MRSVFALATTALIVVGQPNYPNANIPFLGNYMDCTSCIRGGYDYCIYGNE